MKNKHKNQLVSSLMLSTTLLGVSSQPAVVLAEGADTTTTVEIPPSTEATTTVAQSTPVTEAPVVTTPETTVSSTETTTTSGETPEKPQLSSTTVTTPETTSGETPEKPQLSSTTVTGDYYDKDNSRVFLNGALLTVNYTHAENVSSVTLYRDGAPVGTFSGTNFDLTSMLAELGTGELHTWGISFTLTDKSTTDVTDISSSVNAGGKILARDTQQASVSLIPTSASEIQVTSSISAFVDIAPTYGVTISDNAGVENLIVTATLDGVDVSGSLVKDSSSYSLPSGTIPESGSLTRTLVFQVRDKSGNISEVSQTFNVVYKHLLASSTTFTPSQGCLKNGVYYGDVSGSFANSNAYGIPVASFKSNNGSLDDIIPLGNNAVIAVTDTGFEFDGGLTVVVDKDSDAPVITSNVSAGKSKEYGGYTLLRDEVSTVDFSVNDAKGIKTVNFYADGTLANSYDANGDYTFALSMPVNRDVEFKVEVVDISGNVATQYFLYKVDKSTYAITNVQGLQPKTIDGNKAYLPSEQNVDLTVTGDYTKILKLNDIEIQEPKVKVSHSGIYKLSLENIWGEIVNADLLGLLTGSTEDGELVVDVEAPVATIKADKAPNIVDGVNVYSTLPVLSVSATDNEGLESVVVAVNGNETNALMGIKDKDAYVNIDLSKVADTTEYSVRVTTTDLAGHSSIAEYHFVKDSVKPSISKVNLENATAEVYGDKVYLTESPKISVSTITGYSGLQSLTLNGHEISENSLVTLTQLENNKLRVLNNLSISSDIVDVMEALGLSGKSFVVDGTKPTADIKFGGLQVIKDVNWITTLDKGVTISLGDNELLKYASVELNGEVVKTKSFDSDKSGTIKLNLSDYSVSEGYEVKVTVVDRAGNIYETSTYVIYDGNSPKIDGAVLVQGTPYEFEEGVYVNATPIVDVSTAVGSSGEKETYLDGKEHSLNGIELKEGQSPKVQVEDNLGRKSPEVKIMDLLGYPNKTFIIDTEKPTVSSKSSTVKNISSRNWFVGDNQSVEYSFKDNKAIKSYTVIVNGKTLTDKELIGVTKDGSTSIDFTNISPNADGSYIVDVIVTDKANNTENYREVYYSDSNKPKVTNFNFIQEGFKEGSTLTINSSSYGFFFKSATTLRVEVMDEGVSSGLSHVELFLKKAGGETTTVTAPVQNGYAEFAIPNNFKGWVSANVTDNVGLTSSTLMADGVITEDANWHISTSRVNIDLPSTPYRTASGQPLYNADFVASGTFSLPVSGLSHLDWSTGNTMHEITNTDLNLGIAGRTSTAVSGNSNNMQVGLTVVDKAGHSSSATREFSIDKDAPVINVTWNQTTGNNLYSSARTATIVITERNFDPSAVRVTGIPQGVSWSSNGDVHTALVTFGSDGEHQFSISATDLAGNTSQTYSSERFDVDTTAPVITVDMSGTARNGYYFNQVRTATIRVADRHFSASNMQVTGGDVTWVTTADGGVGTVVFNEGEHSLSVTGSDALGHQGNTVTINKFIVDTTAPQLSVTGVSNGASYTSNVFPIVTFSDKYLDAANVRVTLRGRRLGTVTLNGSIQDGRLYLDGLPEGDYDDIYELTVHVEDLAGNVADQNITFSLNRNGSKYSWLTDDITGGYYKKLPKDLVLTETSVTRLDTSKTKFTYTLNGRVVELDIKPIIKEYQNEYGYWVYEYIFPKEAFKQNGVWSVSVSTVDVNGKASSSDGSVSITFVIDDTAPTITILDLKDKGIYYEATKKVQVLVNDNIGVIEASIFVNNEEFKFSKEELEKGQKEIELERSDSEYDVRVVAKDKTGNVEEKAVQQVFVTSNAVQAVVSSSQLAWVRYLVGAASAIGVGSIVGWWYLVAKKRRKEEEEIQRQAKEASTSNLNTENSTSNAEK